MSDSPWGKPPPDATGAKVDLTFEVGEQPAERVFLTYLTRAIMGSPELQTKLQKWADLTARGEYRHIREEEMAEVGREELTARLEAVEARTQTRFVEVSGKLDRMIDSVTGLSGRVEEVRADLSGRMAEVRADNRNTRFTIVITVVVAVLAAGGALWTTQSNLLNAFSTGIAVGRAPPAAPIQ